MARLLTLLLVSFVIIGGFSEAQQRSARGEAIALTPQMIEALQAQRFDRARVLVEEARARAWIAAERTPLSMNQIQSFLCTPRSCWCNGAEDCLDLGQTGLCKPGTTECDSFMNECQCQRTSAAR